MRINQATGAALKTQSSIQTTLNSPKRVNEETLENIH